jgi:hypothetical protein
MQSLENNKSYNSWSDKLSEKHNKLWEPYRQEQRIKHPERFGLQSPIDDSFPKWFFPVILTLSIITVILIIIKIAYLR